MAGLLACSLFLPAPVRAAAEPSEEDIQIAEVVHYLFWAAGVDFRPCPQDLNQDGDERRKVVCGTSAQDFESLQTLLDAALLRKESEGGPPITPLTLWETTDGLTTKTFGCCGGSFELQLRPQRRLVLVAYAEFQPQPILSTPAGDKEKPPRPPATGEVLLQPGDALLGPEDGTAGTGRYSITITGPGDQERPIRMTWEQSKAMNMAYRAGIEGRVGLRVTVAPDGTVESAQVVDTSAPDLGFEEAALLALGQWSLDPALLEGAKKSLTMNLVVRFPAPGATP